MCCIIAISIVHAIVTADHEIYIIINYYKDVCVSACLSICPPF